MRIKEAAVKHEGQIFTGRRHGEAILKAVQATDVTPVYTVNQGFMTECGKFVDRAEAARIAYLAGQIDKPLTSLCSEDLDL
jgi:hypothetical protein